MEEKEKITYSKKKDVRFTPKQIEFLSRQTTKLGFESVSDLIRACISKGFPLVRKEKTSNE